LKYKNLKIRIINKNNNQQEMNFQLMPSNLMIFLVMPFEVFCKQKIFLLFTKEGFENVEALYNYEDFVILMI
jgi:hypothetical protein